MQVAELDMKIAQKMQKVVRSPEDEEKIKALEVQRAAAEKAVERYVKETRAKADLGILSNEAAALERKVEYSTSPVERAEAEAKLAELETPPPSHRQQAEHDEKIKERLAKLRVAVAKYPKNHLLRKRQKYACP